MTERQLVELEEYEFQHGPLSVLQSAVQDHSPVLISCRNDKQLYARVKAFDRHSNMVLENVKEMWYETVMSGTGKNKTSKKVARDRFIPKMFLRGDTVILVMKS